ncbi:MAG: phosphoglycerate dehydrogenase, partial [bacterium]
MKILITDSIDREGVQILEAEEGIQVFEDRTLKGDRLAEAIGDYDALITRSGTNVTAEILERADKLKVIGRAGVGVDNVDIEAASRRGVVVLNTPTGNTLAATEHTMAMMLSAV